MVSFELRSHPNTRLDQHLLAVAEGAGHLAAEWPTSAAGAVQACHLAGLCHDLGKATRFFQERLQGKGKRDPRGNHAMFGAVAGWWLASRRGLGAWAGPIAIAVARHHGNLRNVSDLFTQIDDTTTDPLGRILEEQVESLRTNSAFHVLVDQVALSELDAFVAGEWRKAVDGLRRLSRAGSPLAGIIGQSYENWPEDHDAGPYSRHRRVLTVYGALLAADKRCAANVEEVARRALDRSPVSAYIDGLERRGPAQVADYRIDLGRVAQASIVAGLVAGERQFRLTAPTGSGKTLAALDAALEARQWMASRTGKTPRIVYALPYISVITQTVDTFRSAFATSSKDALVLASHHLAIPDERRDDEEISVNDAMRWIQDWEGEAIVTTFQQVMSTMFGIRNRDILRYPHLRGAVVVLDEAQNFPAEHWPIVQAVTQELVATGSVVIAMSATNPMIFEGRELAPSSSGRWPRDRVLTFHPDTWDDDALAENVLRKMPAHALLVVNTVARSRRLTRRFEGKVGRIMHLSTNITPIERAVRIAKAESWLREDAPCIVVATQLIEAGVDLDFDVGFREAAPIDNIVQCLGRINRNHDPQRVGRIHVFPSDMGTRVYGPIRMGVTREMCLSGEYSEAQLDELVNRYFETLRGRVSQLQATERLDSLRRLRYDRQDNGVGSFDLINERGSTASILVELDDTARELRRTRAELLKGGRDYDKVADIQVLNRRLAAYRVNTYQTRLPPPLRRATLGDPVPVLASEMLTDYYDSRSDLGTGLIWPEERADDYFL